MNIAKRRIDLVLLPIVILAAILNAYGIWKDQYANSYYTTAVGSMLRSFHNFFYASLDSAGSVTVDKPPVVFWIQTAFAYVFGLHGWSVILPQVLAGIGAVLLIYFMVKPSYGLAAARIAALVMATVPVVAAVSRTNNIDSMLVFTLLLGSWFLFKGAKQGSVWRILMAFALIGLAFNMKMLQAYMVLPAFYLFYLLAFQAKWRKKLLLLVGSTAIMAAISLSWAVTVDSIPADERPYIGSSETNSVLELAFGYNGLSRLTGRQNTAANTGMPDASNVTNPQRDRGDSTSVQTSNPRGGTDGTSGMNLPQGNEMPNGFTMPQGGFGGGGGTGGMFGTGQAGPLRLFQTELSGQASWFLPLALLGCIAIMTSLRRRNISDQMKEAIFWLAWLLPVAAFFSVAGFFHQYYLIMLAPPIAALSGAGFVAMWKAYQQRAGWQAWLLPLSVLLTTIFGWYIMQPFDETIGAGWSISELVAGIVVTVVLIVMMNRTHHWKQALVIAGFMVTLIGPVYWAFTPITYGGNSMIPAAGPTGSNGMFGGMTMSGRQGERNNAMTPPNGQGDVEQQSPSSTGDLSQNNSNIGTPPSMEGGMNGMGSAQGMPTGGGRGGFGNRNEEIDSTTLQYLREHNTGETYLFATSDYNQAAPYIIDENEAVITLGGFSGSDPVYTTERLEQLVKSGQLKYFIIGGGMGGRGGNAEITNWIMEHGTEVPSSEWRSNSDESGGFGNQTTLYEVKM
ncbi:4-amino-4-deoxy-L-arabinose transferase-like glycosyltransferase [Paenibacillus amylolyticus]|uniref:4-amino-4-deoxy-L-arabinose transferase-like glycosyltransferase n=1 Tax=Paenibacillus amylolyticus TaxID=1451 RepID=A0AAP5H0E7_PAEAM|nr:glycosyltransferase family 39 protein [Paenibacillus amylolyticus]MDR6723885.1 4-amino-4-deoxy-L-arabinose transferase-like glycosyltransferase [Paenibacillus amylolyticus]